MKLHAAAILFFALCASVAFADINSARKEGIRKVDEQIAYIKKVTEEASLELDKRTGNIRVITTHQREYGDSIFRQLQNSVAKSAKSAYMMANLLGSPNEVFRCIESREREALDESSKLYSKNFLDAGRENELKAENYQRDLIKAWKDDYYKAVDQYNKIYQKAVSDIQKATKEPAIDATVKDFQQTTKQMEGIVVSIFPALSKTHIQVLKIFNGLVHSLYEYSKYRVEETNKLIENCFVKF